MSRVTLQLFAIIILILSSIKSHHSNKIIYYAGSSIALHGNTKMEFRMLQKLLT